MYTPSKRWQKLEKVVSKKIVNGKYLLGEEKWVSDILKLSSLKNTYSWVEARKLATLKYMNCVVKSNPENETYCSCRNDVHEMIYVNFSNYCNNVPEESWE